MTTHAYEQTVALQKVARLSELVQKFPVEMAGPLDALVMKLRVTGRGYGSAEFSNVLSRLEQIRTTAERNPAKAASRANSHS